MTSRDYTPGNGIDYEDSHSQLHLLREEYNIREIAIAPWNATHLAQQLQGDGFEVVTFGQGFKDMTAPTKLLESLVISRKLKHAGNPVLRRMASNVAVEEIDPTHRRHRRNHDGARSRDAAAGAQTVGVL